MSTAAPEPRLHRIALAVDDLADVAAEITAAFGGDESDTAPDTGGGPGRAGRAETPWIGAGYELIAAGDQRSEDRPDSPLAGLVFAVADLDAATARMLAAGATVVADEVIDGAREVRFDRAVAGLPITLRAGTSAN